MLGGSPSALQIALISCTLAYSPALHRVLIKSVSQFLRYSINKHSNIIPSMADQGSKLIHKVHILIEGHTAEYSVYVTAGGKAVLKRSHCIKNHEMRF